MQIGEISAYKPQNDWYVIATARRERSLYALWLEENGTALTAFRLARIEGRCKEWELVAEPYDSPTYWRGVLEKW